MNRLILRITVLAVLLATLAAVAAFAQQVVPAGKDYWTTPANGRTYFTFPPGDVESLCGAAPSDTWDHKVVLQGVPIASGPAYDTVVARLQDAVFDATGTAQTPVQVVALSFASSAPQKTPCGALSWTAGPAGAQGLTTMTLHRTSPRGGTFNADLKVATELKAFDSAGNYVGSLFYNILLQDPGTGTPWSFSTTGQFRAGMTETDNCIAVLRQKLSTYPTDSSHYYYISDLISQGRCSEITN